MELMQVNKQWSTRPADQRFTSLTELNERVNYLRDCSRSKVLSSRGITAVPVDGDHTALMVVGPNGGPVNVTHWSFGQLAGLSGAPAGYLRNLPSPLAADCVNYGMKVKRDISDVGVLLYQNGGPAELRAVTGPNYGRIWNATITQALVDRFGNGLDGQFHIPGEFGRKVPITKENTTLYASDRDMFVFLADESHRIEIKNRRNGEPGTLSRGFFVWNSEVGAATFGIATFLFDYACSNRIVWGAQGYKEMRIRHTSSAPDKWIHEVAPALEKYAESSTDSVVAQIESARSTRIGNSEAVDKFLQSRFTKSEAVAIKAAHMQDEQKPIETLWDATTAVTAYARAVQYQDERVKLEREGGKILDLALR